MTLRFALLIAALLPACAATAATLDPQAGQPILALSPCAGSAPACALNLGQLPAPRHIMLGAPRGAIAITLPPALRPSAADTGVATRGEVWNAAWDKVDLLPMAGAGSLAKEAEKASVFSAGLETLPITLLVAAPAAAIPVTATPQMAPMQLPALHGLSSTPLAIGLAILAFLAGRRRGLAAARPVLG